MVLPERARPAPVDPMAEVRRQRAQQAAAITGLAEEADLLMAEAQRIFTHYAEAEAGLARMALEEGPPRFEILSRAYRRGSSATGPRGSPLRRSMRKRSGSRPS